jgi:hypothetical protein
MPGSKASWVCARFRFEGWPKCGWRCSGLALATTCNRGCACENRGPRQPRARFRKAQGQEKTESTPAARAKKTKSLSRHKNRPARDVSSQLLSEGCGFRRSVATSLPPNSHLARYSDDAESLHPRRKNLYQTCPSQSVQFSPDFVQRVLVLHHFCPSAQLFPPPLRATLKRKVKYETVHAIACPENPSRDCGTGSKGSRRAAEGSKGAPVYPERLPAEAEHKTGQPSPFPFSLCAFWQNVITSNPNIKNRRK